MKSVLRPPKSRPPRRPGSSASTPASTPPAPRPGRTGSPGSRAGATRAGGTAPSATAHPPPWRACQPHRLRPAGAGSVGVSRGGARRGPPIAARPGLDRAAGAVPAPARPEGPRRRAVPPPWPPAPRGAGRSGGPAARPRPPAPSAGRSGRGRRHGDAGSGPPGSCARGGASRGRGAGRSGPAVPGGPTATPAACQVVPADGVCSRVVGSGGGGCDGERGALLGLGCVELGRALELPGAVLMLPVVAGLGERGAAEAGEAVLAGSTPTPSARRIAPSSPRRGARAGRCRAARRGGAGGGPCGPPRPAPRTPIGGGPTSSLSAARASASGRAAGRPRGAGCGGPGAGGRGVARPAEGLGGRGRDHGGRAAGGVGEGAPYDVRAMAALRPAWALETTRSAPRSARGRGSSGAPRERRPGLRGALLQTSVRRRSRCGSEGLEGRHDEALGCALPHDERVQLQRRAQQARLASDRAGPGDGLACAA